MQVGVHSRQQYGAGHLSPSAAAGMPVLAQTFGQEVADKQGRVVEYRPETVWNKGGLDWLGILHQADPGSQHYF